MLCTVCCHYSCDATRLGRYKLVEQLYSFGSKEFVRILDAEADSLEVVTQAFIMVLLSLKSSCIFQVKGWYLLKTRRTNKQHTPYYILEDSNEGVWELGLLEMTTIEQRSVESAIIVIVVLFSEWREASVLNEHNKEQSNDPHSALNCVVDKHIFSSNIWPMGQVQYKC